METLKKRLSAKTVTPGPVKVTPSRCSKGKSCAPMAFALDAKGTGLERFASLFREASGVAVRIPTHKTKLRQRDHGRLFIFNFCPWCGVSIAP